MRTGLLTCAMLLAAWAAFAQSPRGEAEIELNGVRMSIEYGRPSLAGRDMLGRAPVGYVWRLGADRSTTLTLTGRAVFGNIVVPEGEYSLFVERTSERGWSLVVNRQTGQWGTEHDRAQDLVAFPLSWTSSEESAEQLTIALEQESSDTGLLKIHWGTDVLQQRFRLPAIP